MLVRYNIYSNVQNSPSDILKHNAVGETTEFLRKTCTSEKGTEIKSSADGDCLFNAVSIHSKGDERLSVELRYKTVLMMESQEHVFRNQTNKANIFWTSPEYNEALKSCTKIGCMSSIWTIMT